MQTEPNIVHESEVQRQHVRLQLPAHVEVDGAALNAYDWSNGGVCIEWDEKSLAHMNADLKIGKTLSGKLQFQFEGFDLAVPMQFEVRYISQDRRRIGCRFANLDARQTSILHFLVGAYVSGEIVQANDLIHVVGRNNFTVKRKVPSAHETLTPAQQLRRHLKQSGGTIAVVAVSLLLALYIVTSLYERVFVVTAHSAAVAADLVLVDVPSGGKLFFQDIKLDQAVKRGDPLVMVATANGNMVSVDSPCDCLVKERLLENNAQAREGQTVLKLAPVDAKPYVKAYVPFARALRLGVGDTAHLRLPGAGTYAKGSVASISSNGPEGMAVVIIEPTTPLPVALIDDPAEVKVDTLFAK